MLASDYLFFRQICKYLWDIAGLSEDKIPQESMDPMVYIFYNHVLF